ncbi:MAG: HAD-IA family hydrolase, partial [Clostridia bacterium]|nr:HAD-IA family hydrolase [Clostridia bacterium]
MNTYLFDFDGTLVDSMPTYVQAMLKILDDHHISYGKDVVKTITPLGAYHTALYFQTLGVPMETSEMINEMGKYMLDKYWYEIPAKPYVAQMLKTLRNSGASLNILTASPHITLDKCLERLGLFDHIWSTDDFKTTKSDPAIYHMAAERIGKSAEEILFLDDNPNACETAKRAGMKVCGVYDASSAEFEEEMRKIGDFYIR